MLPSQHIIDYEGVLFEAIGRGTANTALLLQERLPSLWLDAYVSTISHEPNLVRFRHHTMQLLIDFMLQSTIRYSADVFKQIKNHVAKKGMEP